MDGFEAGAGEEDLLRCILRRPGDSMDLVPPEAMAGATPLESLFGGGLDLSAGLPLVAGEDDETLDGVCFVCEATESDRPLVDDGEDSVATKTASLAAGA